MSQANRIIFKSFIRPFYKENAGVFVFVFTIMFFMVNKVDGAGLMEYHYSLIIATLKSSVTLLLVFLVWFLYARKFIAFVSDALRKPEYAYLQIFNCLSKGKRLQLFFILELWLFLPVLLYSVFIIVIGFRQKFYAPVFLIISFLLLICVTAAVLHIHFLQNRNQDRPLLWKRIVFWKTAQSFYPFILLGFIANQQKLLWLSLKIFTCSVVYLISRNNTLVDYDNKNAFLFFSFGIIANSILIHRIRAFEDTYLIFYRGAPVTLFRRFSQYSLVYGVLLVPEFITLSLLLPVHLHFIDALSFSVCGYSSVLLMNSITFAQDFSMKEYLKIVLMFFFVQYILLMTIGLIALFLLFFMIAGLVFWRGYLKFERLN